MNGRRALSAFSILALCAFLSVNLYAQNDSTLRYKLKDKDPNTGESPGNLVDFKDPPNVKTIYSIKRKKNNKAVIRFASESNLDSSTIKNSSVVKPSIDNCGNLTGGIDDIQLFINELIQYQFDEEKISLNLIFNLGFIGVLLFSGLIYLLTTNQIIKNTMANYPN